MIKKKIIKIIEELKGDSPFSGGTTFAETMLDHLNTLTGRRVLHSMDFHFKSGPTVLQECQQFHDFKIVPWTHIKRGK